VGLEFPSHAHSSLLSSQACDPLAPLLHSKELNVQPSSSNGPDTPTPGGQKVADAARTAADAMGTAADYVRSNGIKGMAADVQRIVKNNPGPALLAAAALGFLLARTLSRD
jgi:hypothetical protein